MAKKRLSNYVFAPGVASSSNAFPNAYTLINNNKTFITKEATAYIANQVSTNSAQNLYPNAVSLLNSNATFIADEISAWTSYQVTNNIGLFAGYTYTATEIAKCKRDVGYSVQALISDLKFGGTEQSIYVANQYYLSGTVQVINVAVEVAIQAQLWTIINNVLNKITYSSQQSPVTSTQVTTGTTSESLAVTQATTISGFIRGVLTGGLSSLPTPIAPTYPFTNYVYDSAKCERDVGFVLNAYLNDLRYGGNAEISRIASRYWSSGYPQIIGDRTPEVMTHQFIRDLINNTVLTQAAYTQLQNSYPRYTNNSIVYEGGATTRITTLSGILTTVIVGGPGALPTLVNGVTSIKVQGKIDLETLLLVTNTTTNTIMYNFADSTHSATVSQITTYDSNGTTPDADFPQFKQVADYITFIAFDIDTSTCSKTDSIQIFVESGEQKVRPYDFGTDAIERMRVAQPQSMLDADFEYGLQPTKWQAIGLARGYPSVYEVPGTDIQVTSVTTNASVSTNNVGESLITVTTVSPHGFNIGTPFTISAFGSSISGFARAEGSFLVNTVPTPSTFTYYATSKVGTNNGDVLSTTYTQLRKAAFYTGASIGSPVFNLYSNGSAGTITTQFITSSGSNQFAYNGTLPTLGTPLSGTGIATGTQVTGTVGSGGLSVTAYVAAPISINDTVFTVSDPTGILEGMAVDNGSGVSSFVVGLTGNQVTVTSPFTAAKAGNLQTYLNKSGTNVVGSGTGAIFDVSITGVYSAVVPNVSDTSTGYAVGNRIIILGSTLGGVDTANDLVVRVDSVDLTGKILTASVFSGNSFTNTGTYVKGSPDAGAGVSSSNSSALTGPSRLSGVEFVITKVNGTYSVALLADTDPLSATFGLNYGGANFAVDDTITISGTLLGGTSPANDLVITIVTTTTQLAEVTGDPDWTGVIDTFTFVGNGNQTFTSLTGTNIAPGTGATFDIIRNYPGYSVIQNQLGSGYQPNDVVKVPGNVLGGTVITNDALVTINTVNGSGAVTGITITGTGAAGSTISFYSTVTLSDYTTETIANSATITTAAIARIQITFASAHGLVPGASMLVDITSTGTNHTLARGPFFVEYVPSPTTVIYTARTSGVVDTATALIGTVYARPNSFFTHRPYDGGVQLGTGGPQHGAQALRMSKKYIRYQSGKGIMYTTGALFAPSYNIQSMTAAGTAVGSLITLTTDDSDHGCQPGGKIKVIGVDTPGYNGTYVVNSIISERVLTVRATTVLTNVYATITTTAQMTVYGWHGATVRAGTFDDQNGMFWQYDGIQLAVGRRSSTLNLAGTINIAVNSNLVTGLNTRFRDQVKAGDRITIKGMTHLVSSVTSQTTLTVTPDYRGNIDCAGAKACLIQEFIAKQSEFNLDRLDGTGPSGYNFDVGKMQMIGIQWSWYGAGFIDFMLRGSDGNFIMVHRIRNSNVNTEAYMRTGNMPVRYEVTNEGAGGKLYRSISASATTIPLTDASFFPNESGLVYIDNELIAFSGKSGNNLIGCTRAAPLVNYVAGATRSFTAGTATTHEVNTGVILISNTISPNISHWGSAFLTDGRFDDDRGYLFNYASTGLQASTTIYTAFLMRLAPSVSNAIIGDLGERELINRAQLLLKEIQITSDGYTGVGNTPVTGGIVVQGVLNPQNYPTDPGAIGWSGLSSSAAGGQPSFAQVASGGSVSWSGGASTTTSTATTIAAPTGQVALPASTLFSVSANSSSVYVDKTSWDTLGAKSGYAFGTNDTRFTSGTVVSNIASSSSPVATMLGQIVGYGAVGYASINSGNNYIYLTQSSVTSMNLQLNTYVVDGTFPTGTYVNFIGGPFFYNGTNYQQVNFSQAATQAHFIPGQGGNNFIGFGVGGTNGSSTYNAGTTIINFTQTSWAGLPIGTGVINNTLNDVKFPNGTYISNIGSLQTFNGVSYYPITFSAGSLISISGGSGVTFNNTAYYQLTLSKPAVTQLSVLPVTGASGVTGTVTITFSPQSQIPYPVGTYVTVSGITGGASGYNATALVTAASNSSVSYANATTAGYTSGGIITPLLSLTPAIVPSTTSFLYFSQSTWETLVATYSAAAGTLVVTPTYFPSGTTIQTVSSLLTFGGTSYYRVSFTQTSIASVSASTAITFQFGLPAYALPGETVFSFIAAPGTTTVLDLSDLKELTNTTLGGRGCYPNGPDVLAINIYRASGSGSIGANVLVRWSEAQA